ncbi:MAG TPA: FAD/NAD(P)-binding protein [Stellaceae bacterium]
MTAETITTARGRRRQLPPATTPARSAGQHAPAAPRRPTIAVIGAGFSGTLLALHLLRRSPASAQILLIERNAQFGLGLAYSTGNPNHLLNAAAGRMSAFSDRPLDFVEWLRARHEAGDDLSAQDGPPTEASFVPRWTFGAYVRHLLNAELRRAAEAGKRLSLIRGDAVCLARSPDGLTLTLDRERVWHVDAAVLAVGNFPPEAPPIADPSFYDTRFYRADPWAPDTLTGLDPAAPVLLIGTGLTMIDTVVSLLDRGHTGPIHALSRRGLLPHRHLASAAAPQLPADYPLPTGVVALTRMMRTAVAEGGDWRAVVDGLRPLAQRVWQAMPQPERARFSRHARAWWEVHRHRIAPEVADRIDAARAGGQLVTGAGRLRDCRILDTGEVEVAYQPRGGGGGGEPRTLRVARVVNCSGPGCDYDRIAHPLVRRLLDDGAVRPDPLRLGLDVTDACALRDRDGLVSDRLYAVGPVTKGAFWEITSVPDIRRQCEGLAAHLAHILTAVEAQNLPAS